ncbi:arabinose-5-phosphate isomerase [Piscirickettsia salmonis]|uniref:Arabinose 5-phosphate isomerase n=1 Tax=Piscirickettsia salmonis TaxID=1238 RepID=A0A9Q6LJK8_PISSA|nr:KpsF/GutQ family sugar-phosphate isomerase [Piscirickettsia salmonis]ALA24120.1 sugar isomerase KpsF [Piscirickettsia salmonis]APS44520.1 arabinose-5-phosphate isomerase [Piscirickettsia salmonis]APS47881.1 arabinose-5-phosphate isomerase [Piscirickettsia salmonis]APS51838.1 arabinose-5-phosphate isomerase [Piscirickettsia salmonis]APS55057.1 arabinose-5-phosphate isomerase [Piscirickettsia salmonis]
MQQYSDQELCELGQEVINTEIQSLQPLIDRIGRDFVQAIKTLLHCQGRIIVTGMGKSGHIGNKIAATMASTGTPAFFVHPGEAGHGDLGMIQANDVVLAISYSGNSSEILTLTPHFHHLNVPLITMTGNPNSELAHQSIAHLDISVAQEACPLGLAPTSSTTATLVMGDALAITLLKARGFTEQDFALSHPLGRLGRRLLLKVADLMHTGDQVPSVGPQVSLSAALLEISNKRLGMTTVANSDYQLLGIFTDGDLRRALQHSININTTSIDSVMGTNPKTISPDMLAIDCLQLMEESKITSLVVTDHAKHIRGVIHMHDLLQAGLL